MGKQVGILARVIPEPVNAVDGKLVISLLLQPDDSEDAMKDPHHIIDLDRWPAEIFGRLQSNSIFFRTNDPNLSIQAEIREWIPQPVDAEARNDLWVKAVGAEVLSAAAASASRGVFVETAAESITARRVPPKPWVFHTPVRSLATSMNALMATSVLAQLGAQAVDSDTELSGKANPLAPSTQQSVTLFDVFEGTRPKSRSDDEELPETLRELVFGESADALVTRDILSRLESNGRIRPDAANRIDAIFEDAQAARSRGRDAPAIDQHLGRIPPDLQEAIFKRVKASTAVADRGTGKLSLADEFENVLEDKQYFEAAVRGFVGDKTRGVTLSEADPQIIDDYAAYLLAMQADSPRLAKQKLQEAETLGNDAQTALRVISGLYSYPQLAAFFGLLVDVEIDAARLPQDTTLLAVELGQTVLGWPINAPVWTAISVSGVPESRRIEVRPRNQQSPLAQCDEGLLRMGDARVGSVERFDILSLDVNAAVDGMFTAARNDEQSLLDGATREDLSSSLPSQKGPALVIADRAKNLEAGYELTESAEHIEGGALDPNARVLYFEDLFVGYRIDVWTGDSAPFGSGRSMQRAAKFFADDAWLSLMDREVHFPEVEKALADEGHDPELLQRSPDWGVDRMAGSIRSVFREIQSEASEQMVVAYDTLASWSGWSLAVPMLGGSVEIKPGEIGLRRTLAPLAGSLPALRYGSGVAFAARCTLANGSSLTRQAAMELYNNWSGRQKFVLHRGPAIPEQLTWNSYPVLRHEPLATPRIHHRAEDVRGTKAETPNREIVVSAASGDRETAYRVVLPGIATLDESERHGVLDGFDDLPPPPFEDLPIFPKPGASFVDPTVGADPDKDPKTAARVPSYPDPAVRYLSLAFTENGMPAQSFGFAPPVAVDLYAAGARSWPNAGAVELEVAAVVDGVLPLHGRIAGRFDLSEAMPGKSGVGRTRIDLAPAEQIDLTIWSLPAMLFDYARFAPFAATAQLASYGYATSYKLIPDEAPATEVLGAIGEGTLNKATERSMGVISEGSDAVDILQRSLRKLPVPALSSFETVRLIHAVERPLLAPTLDNLFVLHNAPFDAGAAGGGDNEEKVRQAWVAALASWELDEHERPRDGDPAVAFAKARIDYAKGSNRIFIGGNLGLHRKSTGRVDFVGSWRDYSDEIAPRFDRDREIYEYKPRDRVEILASREGIPYRSAKDEPDRIGIALDEDGNETFAGYTFGDTRARKLRVAARGVSRFKSHFEVREGVEDQFALDSEWREEIVLSTERPKPLAAPFCEPSLHYELEAYSAIPDEEQAMLAGRRHRRTVRLRYDLGERFYVTGVDERVGIVCWPPYLFDALEIEDVYAMKVSQVDKEILRAIKTDGGEMPKGAADYITRWGRDPISESGALPALIPASAFRNAVKAVTATLPLPAAKKPGQANTGLEPPVLSSSTIDVSLALFDPLLDPETGRFYVDIEIDQNESYEPWVRLGLVRYQEHSITGLHCSLPVKSMIRIPADRHLEVEIGSDRRLSLRYTGLGHGRKVVPSGVAKEPEAALFARPLLDVTVLRTRDESVSGAPAVVENDELTGLAHVTGLAPRVDDGELEWVLGRFVTDGTLTNEASRELILPTDCELGEISILVTEREHFAADDYRQSFGSSRTHESAFEEPLAWNDTIEVTAFPGTVVTSRIISAVQLKLVDAEMVEPLEPSK